MMTIIKNSQHYTLILRIMSFAHPFNNWLIIALAPKFRFIVYNTKPIWGKIKISFLKPTGRKSSFNTPSQFSINCNKVLNIIYMKVKPLPHMPLRLKSPFLIFLTLDLSDPFSVDIHSLNSEI